MGRRFSNRGAASRRSTAFTLIELLLVMVILVVLAAVVVPRFSGRTVQAQITAAKSDLASIRTVLDAFEIDNARYPSNDEGLQILVNNSAGLPNWHGPYLPRIPADPWGNAYVYQYPSSTTPNGYDLYSWGPDKVEGGNDDIDLFSDTTQAQ